MEHYNVKPIPVPDGVSFSDNEKRFMDGMRAWLQDSFADFEKSNASGEEFIQSVSARLKEAGFDPSKLQQLENAAVEQGKALEKLRMEGQKATNINPVRKCVADRHAEIAKAYRERQPIVLDLPVSKDASVITTSTAVTSTTGAAYHGYSETDPQVYYKRRGKQYIRDIADIRRVPRVPTTMEFWEEGSENGAFAVVAENGLKPLVDLSLVLNQAKKQKAAGMMTVTEEVLMDSDELAINLERLFSEKVWRDYEDGLTASLIANASSYASTSLDNTIKDPNDFDAISAAALQVASLNFIPTDLVLNTSDAYAMSLIKDNVGRYILPIVTDGGQLSIRSLRVTTTTKLAQGEFLVGEYGTWKVREGEAILRSGLNADDFQNNRMSFIGEIFYNSYIPTAHAGSWVKGNFATIKEALKASAEPTA